MSGIHRAAVVHHSFEVPCIVRVLPARTYEFDGYLLVVQQVCAFEYDSE